MMMFSASVMRAAVGAAAGCVVVWFYVVNYINCSVSVAFHCYAAHAFGVSGDSAAASMSAAAVGDWSR